MSHHRSVASPDFTAVSKRTQHAPDFLNTNPDTGPPAIIKPAAALRCGSWPTQMIQASFDLTRRSNRRCGGASGNSSVDREMPIDPCNTSRRISAVWLARRNGLDMIWVGSISNRNSPCAASRTFSAPFAVSGRRASGPSHSCGSTAMPCRKRMHSIPSPHPKAREHQLVRQTSASS